MIAGDAADTIRDNIILTLLQWSPGVIAGDAAGTPIDKILAILPSMEPRRDRRGRSGCRWSTSARPDTFNGAPA